MKVLKIIVSIVTVVGIAVLLTAFVTSETVVVSETTAVITKMDVESSNGTNQYYIAVNDQNEDIVGVYPIDEKTYAKYSVGDLIVVQGKVERTFFGDGDVYYRIRQD